MTDILYIVTLIAFQLLALAFRKAKGIETLERRILPGRRLSWELKKQQFRCLPLLIPKNCDLCFVLSAQSHLVQNGNMREFDMAAELWCHAEVEGLESHWFVLGRSTGIALADLSVCS